MKKRVLAVVSAAVLALGCFTTAYAAKHAASYHEAVRIAVDGEEIDDVKINAAQKKAAKLINDGTVFSVDKTSLDYYHNTDDYRLKAFNAKGSKYDTTTEAGLQNAYAALTHLCAQYPGDKIVRVFEISSDADASNPVDVTIADSDVKAGKTYTFAHMNKTGEWDKSSAKVKSVSAGLVKSTITKASPFALVETTAPATEDNKDAAAKNATGTKTAPKTGEV